MLSASKSGQFGGYTISRSVRLRSSASAYFNRTPAGAGNRTTWTWSGWIKLGQLATGTNQAFFAAGDGTTGNYLQAFFDGTTQALSLTALNSSSVVMQKISSSVYRDPSAWYHIVFAYDSTQATSTNRIKIYVNGVQLTSFSTNTDPALNTQTLVNSTNQHTLSSLNYSSRINYFDGYLTEINFIDGQALTPSSFGQYNAYGVWTPTKYNGTYGNNGFYLNFSDNSGATATTIGKDYSGNGNNWTPNNISVTAGTTYDSMIDVPTLWGDGSTNRGNYCVLNAVSTGRTLSEGNLNYAGSSTGIVKGTIGVSSGKWYWEVTAGNGSPISNSAIGLCDINLAPTTSWLGNTSNSWSYAGSATKYNNGTGTSYGASYASGDIIGVAFDADAGTLTFYKNNVSQGQAFSGITGSVYCPAAGNNTVNDYNGYHNFGQRPFTYTPPSGYKALNTFNLPTPTIGNGANYMAATLYTGNGTSQSINNSVNGVSFQPDFLWLKQRGNATSHCLTDNVRGVNSQLISNSTDAQYTATDCVTAINSNGFTVGANTQTAPNVNFTVGGTYVGWQWQAGQGTTSSNTSGSITSTVSVNTTAGFSVVTYTGNGTAGATIGHGLGVAPVMIIVKNRSRAMNWWVYGSAVTSNNNYGLFLNTTDALQNQGGYGQNNTYPTSTVFYGGIGGSTSFSYSNYSGDTYVAYCWAAIAGYSAFGSYTGNGSADGPFVYCGFRPRFVMVKNITNAADWYMTDTARDTYNVTVNKLTANTSTAESSNSGLGQFDVLSNGFKQRQGAGTGLNNSGDTYIFAAFAENPFRYSLAR